MESTEKSLVPSHSSDTFDPVKVYTDYTARLRTSEFRSLDALCNGDPAIEEINATIHASQSQSEIELGLYPLQPSITTDRILYSGVENYRFALVRQTMGTKLWALMPLYVKANKPFSSSEVTGSDFADKLAHRLDYVNRFVRPTGTVEDTIKIKPRV